MPQLVEGRLTRFMRNIENEDSDSQISAAAQHGCLLIALKQAVDIMLPEVFELIHVTPGKSE